MQSSGEESKLFAYRKRVISIAREIFIASASASALTFNDTPSGNKIIRSKSRVRNCLEHAEVFVSVSDEYFETGKVRE